MSGPSDVVNHQPELQALVSSLFDSPEFSDVQLEVNGSQSFQAHRLLLVTQSSVFRTMLSSPHWNSSKQDMVSLVEDEQCVPHFAGFLRYFYTGTVELDVDSAMPVCVLADKYDMAALRECCQEFMVRNVASPAAFNQAVPWRRYSALAGLAQLREACDEFLARNVDTAARSPGWASMEEEQLCALLQRSDLVTESEAALLAAAAAWLRPRPERAAHVLRHIRLPMIHPDELYQYQALTPGGDDEVHAYIQRGSLISYQANSVSVELLGRNNDLTSAPFAMRLYKSQSAGSSWEMGNYTAQPAGEHGLKFTSVCLQARCKWRIRFYPRGQMVPRISTLGLYRAQSTYREEVFVNETSLGWTVDCGMGLPHHRHRLNVLLHIFQNGEWFVSDIKAFDSIPGSENGVRDLIPEPERQQYTATNSMRLHFVGQTIWTNPTPEPEEEKSEDVPVFLVSGLPL
ncbi:hypothetical protein MATL_G00167870 [Megalops atlanticus]|uniref:BTB domain-containing protein n=1 Tax=Megalops atlanticus TaxID=7932 RepID=A0A9D3PT87_MEGAT|nr:hypothetical protein MATL_G00167870 [Megalops atlanticus]